MALYAVLAVYLLYLCAGLVIGHWVSEIRSIRVRDGTYWSRDCELRYVAISTVFALVMYGEILLLE